MPSIVDDMRSAGFDDATIGSWANEQRPAMKQAGFDDATIEGYFSGLKDPASIPRPFLSRIMSSVGRIGSGVAEGAQAGFGETPLGPTPEDNAKLRASGVYDDGTGNAAIRGLRMANEMVIPAASTAVEGMFRGLNGALMGAGAGVGQAISEATGASETDSAKARRDWAKMVTIGAMLAGTVSPVTRAPKIAGAPDETIGHLPQAEDFTAATKIAADTHRQQTVLSIKGTDYSGVLKDTSEPAPVDAAAPVAEPVDVVPALARQKIVQIYEDHGIHPAEIAADVKSDPEIAKSIMSDDPADLPKKYTSMTPAPETPPKTPAQQPESTAAAMPPAEPVTGFTTAKGSTYTVHEDGTTTRDKAARADVGHEGDSGVKPRTARTIYVDGDASVLSGAGLTENVGGKGYRVAIKDDKATFLWWNEKAEKWGAPESGRNIPFTTKPEIGKSPVELWKPTDDVPGHEAYRGQHAGNKITEIQQATPSAEKPDIFSQAADRAAGQDILDGPDSGKAHALSSDAPTSDDPYTDTPKTILPAGTLVQAIKDAASKVTDIWHDIQMNTVPMALGSDAAKAVSKDFANSLRRVRYEWSRIDNAIVKKFNAEDRARMWSASDEESVALQLGESREHQGLVTLTKDERAAVEQLQTRGQAAFVQARDLGMVEGEGLPSYTPRMLINIATGDGKGPRALNAIGTNLKTTSARLKHRAHMMDYETEAAAKAKFGDDAELARDIRALPLATADLETAIAGRQLIDDIKEIGKRAGEDTVSEGVKPTEGKWFTIDHPAFRTWRPKLKEVDGKWESVKDAEGNVIFEQTPLFVHSDFEGPLRAVLDQKSGAFYKASMELKGKTMSLIMNSPLIHNAVEFGRAFATMPGKMITLRVYSDGAKTLADLPTMREAIEHGMVPIGHRAFNQDITSIMEAPSLKAGRSTTANVLAYVPGLFDPKAGLAVKEAIDKAGDFWHNKMLWDQVAKLQAGLYTNFRDDMIAKGIDKDTAQYLSAHMSNRYAGALPKEAMSNGATKIANSIFFSRSFTMGNLGVMKDMFTGLPRDVMAQIERDVGSVDPKAADYAKNLARRKAISVVVSDMVLLYVGNSLLQSAINVISGRKDAGEEAQGYADRLKKQFQHVQEDPAAILHPFAMATALTPMSENEPGKQDRVFVGQTKDGTAIYMRNPVGKIGEEFQGWFSSLFEMLHKKEGTIFRPLMQIFANDKGFGRKVYDPYAESYQDMVKNAAAIAWHIVKAQTPEGQIRAGTDLVTGQGDQNLNAAQAFGPLLGTTFSKGAPGGPAMGELYSQKSRQEYAVNAKLPDWRRQIQNGDAMGAVSEMNQMGVDKGLIQYYVRTSMEPASRMSGRAVKDFYESATPEMRNRFEDTLRRQQASQ